MRLGLALMILLFSDMGHNATGGGDFLGVLEVAGRLIY